MKLLLTNDDGIHALGLQALGNAFDCEKVFVAPNETYSECSHKINTSKALKAHEIADSKFMIEGSPADCVRLGITRYCPDADWVMSGVNHGANLGVDIYISGTIAAAREAAIHGKKAIAFSHYYEGSETLEAELMSKNVSRVFADLESRPLTQGSLWNVNFPVLSASNPTPEIQHTFTGSMPLPVNYHETPEGFKYYGDYHNRLREDGSDIDLCFAGNITISKVSLHQR